MMCLSSILLLFGKSESKETPPPPSPLAMQSYLIPNYPSEANQQGAKNLLAIRKTVKTDNFKDIKDKYLAKLKKIEETKIKENDKKLKKEITLLGSNLIQAIKLIDKNHYLLNSEYEELIKFTKHKIADIKFELRSDAEVGYDIDVLKAKIKEYKKLFKSGKTTLQSEMSHLEELYYEYEHKANGARVAIFSKLAEVEKFKELGFPKPVYNGVRIIRSPEVSINQPGTVFLPHITPPLRMIPNEVGITQKDPDRNLDEIKKAIESAKSSDMQNLPQTHISPNTQNLPLPNISHISPIVPSPNQQSHANLPANSSILPLEVTEVYDRINQVRNALLHGKLEDARAIYFEIIKSYNLMPTELKKMVYEDIQELYNERKSAERIYRK